MRNLPMVHPLICCCSAPDCSEREWRPVFGYPVIKARRLWTLLPGPCYHGWLLGLELESCPQAFSPRRTLMASEREIGWCTGEPSSASSLPLLLSSLNQALDPQAQEGCFSHAGHKPFMKYHGGKLSS